MIEAALRRSGAAEFAERVGSVADLARHVDDDPRAVVRLAELLDDEDTAVGAAATRALVETGGEAGLVIVARAFTELDDDVGYFIAGAVDALRREGSPVLDRLEALARHHPTPVVRRGARELVGYLTPTG